MPSPELRCLECNRQFADLTADQEVERCAECGKFVVAAPTLLSSGPVAGTPPLDLAAELTAAKDSEDDIPTVGKPKSAEDDLPLAQVVKPAGKPAPPPMKLPDWARRDDEDAPAPSAPSATSPTSRPATTRAADPFRPALPSRPAAQSPSAPAPRTQPTTKWADQPEEPPRQKPRIGLALFVALIFLVMMVAAIGVLGYVVIRGLKMRKVITQADRPAVVAVLQPDAFSRSSVS